MRFLAGYRHHRCDPSFVLFSTLHAAFSSGFELVEGMARVAALHSDIEEILPATLSMLWTQDLHADLDAGLLGDHTLVWSA